MVCLIHLSNGIRINIFDVYNLNPIYLINILDELTIYDPNFFGPTLPSLYGVNVGLIIDSW